LFLPFCFSNELRPLLFAPNELRPLLFAQNSRNNELRPLLFASPFVCYLVEFGLRDAGAEGLAGEVAQRVGWVLTQFQH